MFPIASRREHAPILSQARVAWELDEADTSLPLGFQACPNLRHSSLVCRRLQTGNRRMTRGWAVIDKDRLQWRARVTWMVLLSSLDAGNV